MWYILSTGKKQNTQKTFNVRVVNWVLFLSYWALRASLKLPWLSDKESTCHTGETGSITSLRRPPGEENGSHFSSLAWEILRTEESSGLLSYVGRKIIRQQLRSRVLVTTSQIALRKSHLMWLGSLSKSCRWKFNLFILALSIKFLLYVHIYLSSNLYRK